MKNVFVADFETTTDENDCRVWLWGLYDINTEEFTCGTDIAKFFKTLAKLPNKSKIYFHNLKFDGEFCFYALFQAGFTHSLNRKLEHNEFSTLITSMGVFYSIGLRLNGKNYTIYDSLKIMPMPVRKLSKAFDLVQLKGDIDFAKVRPVGYIPDQKEIDYVQNDVEIVGKSLNYFFSQSLDKMTQASNAFSDFKKITGAKNFERLYPRLDDIHEELKQSYKGGFTYANPLYQNKELRDLIVLDVNSLYPSVMYYQYLPYDNPILYEGKYVLDKLYNLYIQMIRCNFEVKPGHLPTLQLKHSAGFIETEYVTSSKTMIDGKLRELEITLCLTSVDLELFLKHYDVYNLEYGKGWKFKSSNTLFRAYIDKWGGIKEQAGKDGNEGLRTIAKLMMNALYGKFGLNPNIRSKIPTYGEYIGKDKKMHGNEGFISYVLGEEETRASIYIPVASFVTSYARKVTITSAQDNYDIFAYADTDSLHLITKKVPDNISVDPHKLGFWKLEGRCNKARFLRAKSYIENMYIPVSEWNKLSEEKQRTWTFNPVANVYEQIHVACAGLPTNLHDKITFDTFKDGLVIQGKLEHHRVKGGVVLKEKPFTIKL